MYVVLASSQPLTLSQDYAFSEGEKYKEGKFIFEVKQLATLP